MDLRSRALPSGEPGIRGFAVAGVELPAVHMPEHGDAHIWLLPLAQWRPRLDVVAGVLDADERDRAERFRFARDREQFVVSHALMRAILACYLERPAAALELLQPAGEKPRLAGSPPFDFNLSHSGDYALLGVSRAPIGTDIEVLREFDNRDSLAQDTFAPAEIAALASLPPALQWDGFFACWTCKEAYVKALGLGLSAPLDRFVVALDPGRPAALLSIEDSAERARGWSVWGTKPAAGYRAAAAVEHPNVRFTMMALPSSWPN